MTQPEYRELTLDKSPLSPAAREAAAPAPAEGSLFSSLDRAALEPLLFSLLRPRTHLTATPTFVPRNFMEAIQFYDDGTNQKLYVYLNGVWRYVALT